MDNFPTLAISRLMKKHGAKRVSADAIEKIKSILMKELVRKTRKAAALSRHAKRKTIKKEDLEL